MARPASEFHGELNARSLGSLARKVVRRGFVPMSRVSAHAAIATPQSLSRFAPPAASENESISSSIAKVKQLSCQYKLIDRPRYQAKLEAKCAEGRECSNYIQHCEAETDRRRRRNEVK